MQASFRRLALALSLFGAARISQKLLPVAVRGVFTFEALQARHFFVVVFFFFFDFILQSAVSSDQSAVAGRPSPVGSWQSALSSRWAAGHFISYFCTDPRPQCRAVQGRESERESEGGREGGREELRGGGSAKAALRFSSWRL